MHHWNWGIPVDIPEPPGAGPQPLGWQHLKFNQIGIYDIRRRIGVFASEPGIYDNHRARFDSADLAWFAAGLSTEVLHLTQNAFPPEFQDLHSGTPTGPAGSQARAAIRARIQRLTFDLVCIIPTHYNAFLTDIIQAALWDRTFGGATLILHVEGTTRPNAPRRPEFVKADVYFPGYLIQEDPRISPIISELVQKYIADIGMPVIERWERCARSIWSLTQGNGNPIPLPYSSQPMQPNAIPRNSSTFVYHGRPLIPPSPRNVTVVDEYDLEEEELTPSMLEIINMVDQRDTYKSQLETAQAALFATERALRESLAREEELRRQLENSTAILSTHMDGTDPNVNISRRQAGSTSRQGFSTPHVTHHATSPTRCIVYQTPSASRIASPPTLLDRFDNFSPASASHRRNVLTSPSRASPIGRRLFASPVAPSSHSEGPDEPEASATTREIKGLSDYYDFLENHDLGHLGIALDVIRCNLPISSWAPQLENAGVASTLIDSLIISMIGAREV
jgi:hypothetical protein